MHLPAWWELHQSRLRMPGLWLSERMQHLHHRLGLYRLLARRRTLDVIGLRYLRLRISRVLRLLVSV